MSRARLTREQMDNLVTRICAHAETVGLIPLDSRIYWVPGKDGIAPSTPVEGPDGRRIAVSFLPDFVTRDTTRDAYRALSATHKALAVLAGRIQQ